MGRLRIASLLAAGTEMVYGLGLGDDVVAVSHECDFPPEVLDKPRVTSSRITGREPSGVIDARVRQYSADGTGIYRIDVERLESLAPNLIVTQAHCDVCAVNLDEVTAAVETGAALRHARIVALNASTLDDVFADIRRVAEAADYTAAAEIYVASLRARVDAVRRRASGIPVARKPRVVCIEWIEPLILAANWMPEFIELAGGTAGTSKHGGRSGYADWSAVRAFDPEIIVIMPCGFDLKRTLAETPALESLPGWFETNAARTGRVFAVDGNAYFNRSGPRLVDSLEILAHLVHPDRFPDLPACPGQPWRRLNPASHAL